MTDSTEVNGRPKVCDQREHRATPGWSPASFRHIVTFLCDLSKIWTIVIRHIVIRTITYDPLQLLSILNKLHNKRVLISSYWRLTMQILDSIVAARSTFAKIVLPVFAYLNSTPLNIKIGGDSFSTSGNRRLTSVSFSTGLSSGLEKSI